MCRVIPLSSKRKETGPETGDERGKGDREREQKRERQTSYFQSSAGSQNKKREKLWGTEGEMEMWEKHAALDASQQFYDGARNLRGSEGAIWVGNK